MVGQLGTGNSGPGQILGLWGPWEKLYHFPSGSNHGMTKDLSSAKREAACAMDQNQLIEPSFPQVNSHAAITRRVPGR